MYRFLITAILPATFFVSGINAQTSFNWAPQIVPGISVGYTFSGHFNVGLELDVLPGNLKVENLRIQPGINGQLYFIRGGGIYEKIISGNLVINSEFLNAKAGYGSVIKKSGFRKVNRETTSGIQTDFSFRIPSLEQPWIGWRTFFYKDPAWWWPHAQYRSAYIRYGYSIPVIPEEKLDHPVLEKE